MWCIHLIPELMRWKKTDFCEFEASEFQTVQDCRVSLIIISKRHGRKKRGIEGDAGR